MQPTLTASPRTAARWRSARLMRPATRQRADVLPFARDRDAPAGSTLIADFGHPNWPFWQLVMGLLLITQIATAMGGDTADMLRPRRDRPAPTRTTPTRHVQTRHMRLGHGMKE